MIQIDIEEKDKAVVVSMAGELSIGDIDEFEYAFKKYSKSKLDVIALDLKLVPSIDSLALSRIIKISRIFIESGTAFVLINMNDHILQILRISTFDRILNIMTGEEFAGTYFHSGRPVDRDS